MAAREYYERWERELREKERAEGRVEGRAEALLLVLASRFGSLSTEVEETVRAGSLQQLSRWLERAMTAASIADVLES